MPSDPPLKGALDLRGKTSLREAAAILSNSQLFVGLVGFLMHLARAVNCRSVVVYGGRETPDKTGYIANKNLVGVTPCSPCWEENKCDYDRECMKMISVETVVEAVMEQINHHGNPLETEVVSL
jgi:ADP-heptose:LPS heptosyltransferase